MKQLDMAKATELLGKIQKHQEKITALQAQIENENLAITALKLSLKDCGLALIAEEQFFIEEPEQKQARVRLSDSEKASVEEAILGFVAGKMEGAKSSAIERHLAEAKHRIPTNWATSILKPLVADKRLRTTGERGSTTYFAARIMR